MPRLSTILSVVCLIGLIPIPGTAQQHPGSLELGPFYYRIHIDDVLDSGFDVFHDEFTGDGTRMIAVALDEDTGTYAVIQFPPHLMPYAQSVQITGYDPEQPLFDDIRLGMSVQTLSETLGMPSDSTRYAERNITLYGYDHGNYSIEVHDTDGMYSIAINGDLSVLRHYGISDNWLNYEPMQLTYVVDLYAPEADNRPFLWFNTLTFRPRVAYTGRNRPTSPETKELFQRYLQGRNLDTGIADAYSVEIEVSDNGTSYWVMLDAAMLPDLVSESEPDARPLDLFAMLIGFDKDGPLLICNEFVTF
jgi:hypothetical protein